MAQVQSVQDFSPDTEISEQFNDNRDTHTGIAGNLSCHVCLTFLPMKIVLAKLFLGFLELYCVLYYRIGYYTICTHELLAMSSKWDMLNLRCANTVVAQIKLSFTNKKEKLSKQTHNHNVTYCLPCSGIVYCIILYIGCW